MSFASIKAAFKSVFNTPEEEVERHIRADEENDEMSIAKGIIENICLNALKECVGLVRLRNCPDIAPGPNSEGFACLYFVSATSEVECGQLPIEMATHLAKRIRVMANIDGWGHLTTTPYEMDVQALDQSFLLRILEFKLKPDLDVLMKVEQAVRP